MRRRQPRRLPPAPHRSFHRGRRDRPPEKAKSGASPAARDARYCGGSSRPAGRADEGADARRHLAAALLRHHNQKWLRLQRIERLTRERMALETADLERQRTGCGAKMLISGRPPSAETSACARSSKRSQVPSLIQRGRRLPISMTSPNGANASALRAAGFRMSPPRASALQPRSGRPNNRTRLKPPSGWIFTRACEIGAGCAATRAAEGVPLSARRNCGPAATASQALAAQIGLLVRAQQRTVNRHLMRKVALDSAQCRSRPARCDRCGPGAGSPNQSLVPVGGASPSRRPCWCRVRAAADCPSTRSARRCMPAPRPPFKRGGQIDRRVRRSLRSSPDTHCRRRESARCRHPDRC